MAARSKTSFAAAPLLGLWVRIPPGGYGFLSLMSVVCVVRQRSLRRADHSSRGVLPNVVCLSAIKEPYAGGLDP